MIRRFIFLFLSVLFVSFNSNVFAQDGKKQITLDEQLKQYKFYARSVYGLKGMNDGEHYTTLENRGTAIVKYRYVDGNVVDTILSLSAIESSEVKNISGYDFSENEEKILLYTNRERIYRRSFTADFYIYDIKTKSLMPLSTKGKQQLSTFSPDGNKVAFVRENNIYIVDLETGNESEITTDGKFNFIINGAPDWVYEEEFEFNKAFEWSPDGSSIAFMKFDESAVKTFSMTMFEGEAPALKENSLYPECRVWKYPKAGEGNSIVSVHVYNLSDKKTRLMDVGSETDQYIPRIKWTNDPNTLCIYRLNRLQNKLELLFANADNGKSEVVYTDENKYYIDEAYFDNLIFLDDNEHFIFTNETDGFNHIYLYTMKGKLVRRITKGNWDVVEFNGFDPDNKIFYFTAAAVSPIQKELYSVNLKGKSLKKLSKQAGTNHAVFSANYKYYINYYSSATTPTKVTLNNSKGKEIRVLEDNSKLKETLKDYNFNYKEFVTFKTSDGIELNASIIKPPDFNKHKKYPVLMTQYSGPNSQEVLDSWDIGWDHVMAAKGYIIFCVDGRGTGARGEEFRKMTYLQLGKYETIDQIEGAKYLRSLSFVDKDRIGIWGWSFGGFISTLCMEKGDGIFKAGIAVAPVTNWRYYDNIYTERFMRTPQENPKGYDDNSPLFFADDLKGKFLIVHGSADDNVHVQNTMEFTEKLVQANIQFEMQIYTNRNHSIYGGNTRYHLFTRLTNFIEENL